MDDTNDCLFDTTRTKSEELWKTEADLSEEEKFRACFLDCSCECSVRNQSRKILRTPSLFIQVKKITQGRVTPTSHDLGIFDKILKNLQSNHYRMHCQCLCGEKQQRSFAFEYSLGRDADRLTLENSISHAVNNSG